MEFISAQEKQQLQQKLDDLKAKRPVLSTRIAEARALGDLKENADYHAAREDQGMNEAEIRRLEERIKKAQVADGSDVPDGMVFIGSIVKVRDTDNGAEELYKVVGESSGSFNFDAEEIEITVASPMGVALFKAQVGDVVRVELPKGSRRYEVVEVR
jgi:transcription elongation factor GreA